MKTTKLLLTIMVLLTVMSFKKPTELTFKTGNYGICYCGSSVKVELIINDDFTFHYFNNSNPQKKIDIKGNWTRKANTIFLKDYGSDFAIHNKWSIDKNENCLKSRNKLNFTRLCHLQSCK